MKKIDKAKMYFKLYQPISYYLLGMLIVFPFYPAIRQYLIGSDAPVIWYYSQFLTFLAYKLVNLLGMDQSFLDKVFSLGLLSINTILMALWQTVIISFGCLTIPTKFYKRLLVWTLCILGIIAFNVVRIILIAKGITEWKGANVLVINGVMVMLLNLVCIIGGFFWFKNNFGLKKMFIARLKFNSESLRHIFRNIIIAVTVIVIINFLSYTQISPIIAVMSMGILHASHYLLQFLGYHTEIVGRLIQNSQAAIVFSDSCLGLELILLFASFVAILGGKLINKVWFITLGILIIYILNILRISLIFIYLMHNQGKYELALNIHDLYTYSVYIVTFILWAVWINKFSKA